MIHEDDAVIEDSLQAIHAYLKEHAARTDGYGKLSTSMVPLVARATRAILAPRLRLRPDADDKLTELLRHFSHSDKGWSVHAVPAPRPDASLNTLYRSGADLETAEGLRFDVWAFLVNARIGLIAPLVRV